MSDLDYLPDELRQQSLSREELVLPYPDAIRAIDWLAERNIVVCGWEGWLSYPDGRRGHSRRFQGGELHRGEAAWGDYIEMARGFCLSTMGEAQQEWEAGPEQPVAQLYFCLGLSTEDELI